MMDKLFPQPLDVTGPYPVLSRRLRLGVVGGGRISRTQAMAARLSDYWEVVAGAPSHPVRKSRVNRRRHGTWQRIGVMAPLPRWRSVNPSVPMASMRS